MITYKEVKFVNVFLYNKKIGEIKKVDGGWAYFPKGSKYSGGTFSTIDKVKMTLEGK